MKKYGDIIVTLAIIAIISIIIIPIPLGAVDVLLSFNISLSLLILVKAMYTEEALEFSIFPSLLLLTTLFRLALNITTTRYILGSGTAGGLIDTFGSFVMQGNPIVGFIIFLIILVIQFMVITKGAERVSEVAARFTLDAMPGKQMAIDADLNSGLIDDQEAKERRKKVQREADFFGSMDGASKFVKGDSIAGIIITIINIIGGFAIGMLTGDLGFAEALQKYTILTVGDGLVSQIPALLISTAMGIIVTRTASESNLGNDLIKQLFSSYKTMYIISGVLVVFAAAGLPRVPFTLLAVLFLYLGNTLRKTAIEADMEVVPDKVTETAEEKENLKMFYLSLTWILLN